MYLGFVGQEVHLAEGFFNTTTFAQHIPSPTKYTRTHTNKHICTPVRPGPGVGTRPIDDPPGGTAPPPSRGCALRRPLPRPTGAPAAVVAGEVVFTLLANF